MTLTKEERREWRQFIAVVFAVWFLMASLYWSALHLKTENEQLQKKLDCVLDVNAQLQDAIINQKGRCRGFGGLNPVTDRYQWVWTTNVTYVEWNMEGTS